MFVKDGTFQVFKEVYNRNKKFVYKYEYDLDIYSARTGLVIDTVHNLELYDKEVDFIKSIKKNKDKYYIRNEKAYSYAEPQEVDLNTVYDVDIYIE